MKYLKYLRRNFIFLDKIISNFFFVIIVIGIVFNFYLLYFAFFYFLIKIYLRTNRNIPLIEAVRIVSVAQDDEPQKADLILLRAQKKYSP